MGEIMRLLGLLEGLSILKQTKLGDIILMVTEASKVFEGREGSLNLKLKVYGKVITVLLATGTGFIESSIL